VEWFLYRKLVVQKEFVVRLKYGVTQRWSQVREVWSGMVQGVNGPHGARDDTREEEDDEVDVVMDQRSEYIYLSLGGGSRRRRVGVVSERACEDGGRSEAHILLGQ
jgi:hypothetical protein